MIMNMNIIEVENLTKIFDHSTKAVDGASFKVNEKEIFGFLGPNGAGKTTTIKILSTLLKPTDGYAKIAGHDVVKDPNGVRRSIGIVFQDPALDDRLTGRENLDFHARMYGLNKNQREERMKDVLELVGLNDKENILVKNYSGGMKRRLEIARGLMHYPKVLFLDEPTLGLDTQTRRAIWDYIKRLNEEEDITIFLTTHYMEEADYLCHRIAIMDHGKILVIDSPANLKDSIGNDIVILECSNVEKLMNRLENEKWIEIAKKYDSTLVLGVRHGEEKIPIIINLAHEIGIDVNSIEMRKPTLDDVFLHYTGRKIRE